MFFMAKKQDFGVEPSKSGVRGALFLNQSVAVRWLLLCGKSHCKAYN